MYEYEHYQWAWPTDIYLALHPITAEYPLFLKYTWNIKQNRSYAGNKK